MLQHEEWLFKAGHDLESAVILADSPKPLFEVAIYHTQQCAEKALKGFLVWKGLQVAKTHYLPGLLETCQSFDPAFEALTEACLRLNPYSSLYRYPHGGAGPDEVEIGLALQNARMVFDFVAQRTAR